MRRFAVCFLFALPAALVAQPQAAPAVPKGAAPLPRIAQNGAVKQMFVDGKPFIMLAGELHNSSASSVEYMKPIWDHLAKLNLNTVIGTVSWELLEPQEGKFDFTLVDAQIQEARKRNIHLGFVWFGAWKVASGLAPIWVKKDPNRFPVMEIRPSAGRGAGGAGRGVSDRYNGELSAFAEQNVAADARAYAALMRHIRNIDPQHTVIMMQVENEVGITGDTRDRSPLAEAAWAKPVPADLMAFLTKNKASLLPELQEVWERNGYKSSGTWAEVFGDDARAGEIFMAYFYARCLNRITQAGKAEWNIPMFANAWIYGVTGTPNPGTYPSGGPVARVMDIYHAAAPALDFLAPDIYDKEFKEISALYTRAGNPLFFPESRNIPANDLYAIGKLSAMGVSVFGVEDAPTEGQFANLNKLLGGFDTQLAAWQAAGKVTAVLVDGDQPETVSLGGYKITIGRAGFGRGGRGGRGAAAPAAAPAPLGANCTGAFNACETPATEPFALIANIAPDEFLFVGSNCTPTFAVESGPGRAVVGYKDEGHYENGKWIAGRRLNGDEAGRGLPGNGVIGMLRVKLFRLE
ncbi:MAG TPA: DUF5597 domain-containing protein [Bryobacteraceae bacterium]|nr:DUF5597 domain-containing protein [Bryobacteraceae bacterium]